MHPTVSFEVRGTGKVHVAEVADVWPFSCMQSDVVPEPTLRFEDFLTQRTGDGGGGDGLLQVVVKVYSAVWAWG